MRTKRIKKPKWAPKRFTYTHFNGVKENYEYRFTRLIEDGTIELVYFDGKYKRYFSKYVGLYESHRKAGLTYERFTIEEKKYKNYSW